MAMSETGIATHGEVPASAQPHAGPSSAREARAGRGRGAQLSRSGPQCECANAVRATAQRIKRKAASELVIFTFCL